MSTTSSGVSEAFPLLSSSSEGEVTWSETWRCVRSYVTPSSNSTRLLALLALLCELLKRVSGLLPGYAIKEIIDTLPDKKDVQRDSFPFIPVALFVAGNYLSQLFDNLHDVTYNVVEADCSRRFSSDLYDYLLKLGLDFHLRRKTGDVTKVVDSGIGSVGTIVHALLFSILPTLVEASIIATIFVRLGTLLIALTAFGTVIAYFAFTVIVTRWRNNYRRRMNGIQTKANEKAIDTLLNYETVKTFGKEEEEILAYRDVDSAFRNAFVWYRFSFSVLSFGQEVILKSGLAVVVGLAARRAIMGTLSSGTFVLIFSYTKQVFEPLTALGASYKAISQAATDLELCIKMLKEAPTVRDAPDAIPIPSNDETCSQQIGAIAFENVSFSYATDRDDASGLQDVSFKVNPGEMAAFVGAFGTGKSTIMRLTLRFYDVHSGAIVINGEDIRNVTQQSLRKQIGVVTQDMLLFNQTLRYNIAYGKEGASDVEVFAAARSIGLGPFIENLPNGLDTIVGERGVRLSGGEKQMVGIARCIIKDPSIILLDHASSTLDNIMDREMRANLRKVHRGKTLLVVTHRLSTIMMADKIYVLGKREKGDFNSTIVEHGTHSELMEREGVYAELWKAQGTSRVNPQPEEEEHW